MHRHFICLLSALPVVACSKSVDPAYLKAHQERADGICACVAAQPKLPTKTVDGAETYDLEPAQKILKETAACIHKFPGENAIKGPNGEAPGLYEESLKEADRLAVEAQSKRAKDCSDAHNKLWRDVF